MANCSVDEVDKLLPQTQCGLCGYDGCKPYANAIVNKGETINLCPPGGKDGLLQLATLTGQDATPYLADMPEKALTRVVIREQDCIGCRKCINACPVDAIIGAAKFMHTVIGNECTGCERCIEPCPVDCIDLVPREATTLTPAQKQKSSERYSARKVRLAKTAAQERAQYERVKAGFTDADTEATAKVARKAVIDDILRKKGL